MAGFLFANDGSTPVAAQSIADTVDPMYQLHIHNKSKSVSFSGFVPEDFSIGLSADWSSPFADTSLLSDGSAMASQIIRQRAASGSRLAQRFAGSARDFARRSGYMNSALKFAGASTLHKLWTARVWTTPSYLTLDLPILINASKDTKTEVVEPIVRLLSLCAPSESPGGLLVPPGPSPAMALADKLAQIAEDTKDAVTGGDGVTETENSLSKTAGSILDDQESFTVEIGTFFRGTPMIVTNVTSNFDNMFEHGTGNPLNVDFVLTVESYFAITREDLIRWFGLAGE